MPYNVTGIYDDKWHNQPFDHLGRAISTAMTNIDAGWQNVKIECPDNTALKEGLIRELYNAVKSGEMNA